MAKIVFGLGSSHGPLLSTPPDLWAGRVEADKQNPELPFQGGTYTFDELVKLRAPEKLAAQASLEERAKRHAACQTAIATLAERFAAAKLDAVYVPLNFRSRADELTHMIGDCRPRVLIVGGQYVELIRDIAGDLESVEQYVSLEGHVAGWHLYDEMIDEEA